MEWFSKAGLGIFIHWGLYSIPAYDDVESARKRKIGNGSEWYLNRLSKTFRETKADKLTKEYHIKYYNGAHYTDFIKMFTGKKFNADKWCEFIKSCGAKYIVFTAKHHDGFCMWNTKTTDYKVTNSPLKKDVLKELREAAKKYDLKFGIYFSWMEFNKNITKKFIKSVVKPQLEELKQYKPDLWWMDGDWSVTHDILESNLFVEDIHKMGAIINSRLGKGSPGGDYNNFSDRFIPDIKMDKTFECCETIGLSWGYNKMQHGSDYKSSEELFKIYQKVTNMNGNLLLNIAPDCNGQFDKIEEARLIDFSKKIAVRQIL